jgi:uncharacterized damage-inducible protein DinB
MAPEVRSEIVQTLENSRQELNAAVESVSDSQATASPGAGRWSVLECLEHIAAVEERFLRRLELAERTAAPRSDKQREAELAGLVTDRKQRAEAPEPVRPAGRFTSLAQALEHFNAVRTRTIQFAEERAEDLYSLAADHPRFGSRNGLEMLLIISGHSQRHAEQIREARAAVAKSSQLHP